MCCTECFEDSTLKSRIMEQGHTGDCDYCGSTDVAVCDTGVLKDDLLVVIGLYEPVAVGVNVLFAEDQFDAGEMLAEKIQEDWEVFADSLDYSTRSRLLNDIVRTFARPKDAEFGIDVDQLWTDKENQLTHRTHDYLWDRFVRHIKTQRRFVFDESFGSEVIDPREWVPEFLEGVEFDRSPRLFRARLGSLSDGEPFPPPG